MPFSLAIFFANGLAKTLPPAAGGGGGGGVVASAGFSWKQKKDKYL